MPLTKENYENFYLGNGAEHKIMSELFLHGFEAHKFNPDIGIDILVTNKAFSRFKGLDEVSHHLQVKSVFLINGEASFFIDKDELSYLKNDKKAVLILCYFSPIIEAEPKSYDRGDYEPWWESQEASFMRHVYETDFQKIKNEGCLSQIDFKGFEMKYIWLNHAQIDRAIKEEFINYSHDYKGKHLYKLALKDKEDEGISIIGKSEAGHPISEISNIYYLLKNSKSLGRLETGDFLIDHY